MKHPALLLYGAVLLLALSGCAKPEAIPFQRLDPNAPAAQGLPPNPGAAPSPLKERPPFGLFTVLPTPETLELLSSAPISPNGRFRASLTAQGAWVARIDGAWLWQIVLTPPAPPSPPAPRPGSAAPPATPPAATRVPVPLAPLQWTSRGTLVFRDDTGVWQEANPDWAKVAPLPTGLQGKEQISFSPDGKQVLYYMPGKTGKQLWTASNDGANPRLMGENLIGLWDNSGKLNTSKVQQQIDPKDRNLTGPHAQ